MNIPGLRTGVALACITLLASCGGDNSGSSGTGPASTRYTVGGMVTGLSGSGLLLLDNGGDGLPVSGNGGFAFGTALADRGSYAVTVSSQPTHPSQSCSVSNGSGSIGARNVTNIAVTCTTNTYKVTGTISGLQGSGLVLQNNGADNLAIATDATAFTFATRVASGAAYSVSVVSQPSVPAQTCSLSNGSGTVAAGDVTAVALSCGTGTDGEPARVVIDRSSVLLAGVGKKLQLHAQVLDSNGHVLTNQPLTWKSSTSNMVFVDSSGTVSAVAIGSAQIFAQSGTLQSLPALVFVAQPAAAALLLSDAQILSVGPPLNLDPDGVPGVGTQYEVTVQGLTTPPPVGTIVIATEKQPVTGSVVASRQDGTTFVLTLALVPASQLFSDYNIDYTVDLSTFPLQQAPSEAVQTARTPAAAVRARLAGRPRDSSPVAPFKALDCDANVKAQLLGDPPLQLTIKNELTLRIEDRPGFTLRALQGTFTLNPSVLLSLKAGFKVGGSCEAAAQIPIPVDGPLSIFVVPAIRLGLGVDLSGALILAQGKVGVTGQLGVTNVSIGYQCSEANEQSTCETLNGATTVNELKPEGEFPDLSGMEVTFSGQFYFLAGFDADFLLGTLTADLLRAKIGPKQSFDLAFEDDQAQRTGYASSYDLKLVGNVEPGKSLQKIIGEVLGGSVDISAQPQFSSDISQSPKGTLTVSATTVAIGQPVDFSVNFDPGTVNYFLLGDNVAGVQLYRMGPSETKFTPWRFMDVVASNSPAYSYRWVPGSTDDLGKAQYAAFVETKLLPEGLGPLLEVSANSIQTIEVGCFSGPQAAAGRGGGRTGVQAATQAAGTCADQWTGTAHFDYPDVYGDVSITYTKDPAYVPPTPDQEEYLGQGHLSFHSHTYDGLGCTLDPTSVDFTAGSSEVYTVLWVGYGLTPMPYALSSSATIPVTVTCPTPAGGTTVSHTNIAIDWFGGAGGNIGTDGSIQGTNGSYLSYQFTRG